jgi:hypothetical protein
VEKKPQSEELNDPYTSPNIIRIIKSRRIRCAGYVARTGVMRGIYRVLLGKLEGKRMQIFCLPVCYPKI